MLNAGEGFRSVRVGRAVGRFDRLPVAEAGSHPGRQLRLDIGQLGQQRAPHRYRLHLAELEDERRDDVVLLRFRLAVEEQPRLAEMVREGFRA